MLDILAVNLRNALRIFRRSPGFAATAVVSLAIGIAATTGLFSIVNAALLNPFPFADINRIVRLDMIDKGKPRGLGVTARQVVAVQHSDVLDGAFVSNTWEMTLTGQALPEAVRTQYFSANALNTVIGVLARQYFYSGPEILVPIHLTLDPNFAWSAQARLKRGVTPRMAEQRLQPLFDQFANEAPQRFPKDVRPLIRSLVETQRAAGFVP